MKKNKFITSITEKIKKAFNFLYGNSSREKNKPLSSSDKRYRPRTEKVKRKRADRKARVARIKSANK